MANIKELKGKLVIGCRALATEKWVRGFGHVSFRIPDSDLFLMPRNIGLAKVKEEDIWTYNMKGEKLEGGSGEVPSEIPIHYCIFRARPDVMSVCHVHPHNAVLLTMVGETIKPLTMGSLRYPRGVPVFQHLGLIVTEELGNAVARALGDSRAVLLRAHGAVSVGREIFESVTTMVDLEAMARFQVEALMIGKPQYFSPEELEEIRATFKVQETISSPQKRSWEYLVSQIK